jgi:hypothetical protein
MIREEMVDFLCWYYSLPLMPEYEKTGIKPSTDLRSEIFRVKEFLDRNMSEIHKLTIAGSGSFSDDMRRHFGLIRNLRYRMKISQMSQAA